jgi:tetratricopeptide (TPR) repeat protein/thioredoxin-related protein
MPGAKEIILFLCLALLNAASAGANDPHSFAEGTRLANPTEVLWQTDLAASLEQARRSGKHILIDVYTDWCKRLDRDTYSDSAVMQRLTREFICVKINPESGTRERRIVQRYGVRGYPCIIVIDGDGKEYGRISGYRDPKNFLRELSRISSSARTGSEPRQLPPREGCPPPTTTTPRWRQGLFTYKRAEVQRAEDLVRHSLALIDEKQLKAGPGSEHLSAGATAYARPSRSGVVLYGVASDYRVSPEPVIRCRAPLFPGPYEDFCHPNEDLDEIAASYRIRTDAESEASLRRELAIAEDLLSRRAGTGCKVADLANRLAFICCKKGEFGEAERLYQRAIETQEPEGRNMLLYIYQHNLAVLDAVEGKYKDGEQLCRRLIAETLHNLNPMFPVSALQKAARHISDLGCIYEAQQRYENAERLYKNSLAIFEEVDGKMHPFLIRDLRNLVRLYAKQGRFEEAANMHGRLVSVVETYASESQAPKLKSLRPLSSPLVLSAPTSATLLNCTLPHRGRLTSIISRRSA